MKTIRAAGNDRARAEFAKVAEAVVRQTEGRIGSEVDSLRYVDPDAARALRRRAREVRLTPRAGRGGYRRR